jgi:hypothetical protein
LAHLVELCGRIKFYSVDGKTKIGFKSPFIITYNINIFFMMDFFRLLLKKIKNERENRMESKGEILVNLKFHPIERSSISKMGK